MESIKGVAAGVGLFFLSFVVLWKNEGCVDYAKVAEKAVAVKADAVDKSAEGKFVSVTGKLSTNEKLEDKELLQPGNYVRLERKVEMFAWVEHKRTEQEKKLGGKKVTREIYSYEKDWTSDPGSPNKFAEPKGHENPALPLASETFTAAKSMVGAYPFNSSEASLPAGKPLKLSDELLKAQATAVADKDAAEKPAADKDDGDKAKDDGDKAKDDGDKAEEEGKSKKKKGKKRHGRKVVRSKPSAAAKQEATDVAEKKAAAIASRKPASFSKASDIYLFRGTGSLAAPEIGDVRVSFETLDPGTTVTLFGQLKDGEIQPYVKDDAKLFRVFTGTREEAIQTMATEDKIRAWGLRLLGFLMMWFGLTLCFGPLNTFLDVVPFLGSAGRFIVGVAMFPISLLLSLLTILLSIIFHNTILLILFLGGLVGGGYFLYQEKKKKAQAAQASTP